MSDTINPTDLLAGSTLTSIFEQPEDNTLQQTEQTDEVARGGRGRGRLRAAFAQERRRAGPAFRLDLSQRARESRETEAAEDTDRADQAREQGPRGRAALRQQFGQALQAFRQGGQAGQAEGAGEERGGVVTIPVGIERGTRQGGGAAAPAAAETPERPGFQAGAQPTIVANREPPRLDGVRMAASFEQTALGTALNVDRGPASRAAQGPGVGRATVTAARLDTTDQTPLAAGRANAPDRPGFGAGAQPAQGPLARVQNRIENPGSNILSTDQRAPLAANRIARGGDRIGANQLERRPLVERITPGQTEESANAPRAGVGTDTIDRATGRANAPGDRLANPNTRVFNTPEEPLTRGNAAPGQTAPNDQAGLRRDTQIGGGPMVPTGGPAPPQQAMTANNLAGAVGEPAGAIGENVGAAAEAAPGVAPPENPLEPQPPALITNEPAAPLAGNTGQAVPRLADLQAPPEPQQPMNPPPPEPEPPETPAERAAAIRMTPAEAADTELRATVPAPIEPPPGATAPGAPAAPPEAAAANPAARAAGPAEQVGGPAGAPEAAQAPRAGEPVEAGAEEEAGPAAGPPETAPPGAAEEEEPQAAPGEGEEAEEENQAQTQAIAAYELQQMENRTSEPNERRSVTEMFIR